MVDDQRKFSKQLIGKTVVSKSGKRFGEVGDLVFEVKSGELIHVVLKNPTAYTEKLELEKDKSGELLIPCSAVIATGDFVVVSEEDIA
ncbi:MAG TPA: PRC-barrel domain-containing protein [Candidatus Nanoarchaeia archaeon]|nr:PRC-barrel domain-containing protein [Candidatus Nanoarchaeia archaeon]